MPSLSAAEIKNDLGVLQSAGGGRAAQVVLPPVDGDLEEACCTPPASPYSFVDFRSIPEGHFGCCTPLSARIINGAQVDVWPDHFDGLITVDIPIAKETDNDGAAGLGGGIAGGVGAGSRRPVAVEPRVKPTPEPVVRGNIRARHATCRTGSRNGGR